MNSEWMAGVRRRAAVHAALSDAGRLAVVELLSDGDRSPSDLAAAMGISSNLLAHHLNVLAGQGIVERRRSEGDRRRTYLRLVTDGRDLGAPAPLAVPPRVVFVCTANSARSQLAAALWQRQSGVPVDSAGTHPAPAVAEGAVAVARRHRLPMPVGTPKALPQVLHGGDLVITVCDRAHEELGSLAHTHWSVPDPVPFDDEAFEAAFDELSRRIASFAPRLAAG